MSAKVFKEGGKGRKQCPRCKLYIASVCAACPSCHLLFQKQESESVAVKTQRAEKKQAAPPIFSRITLLRIPDGSNPVPLKGRDKTVLLKWAEEVREHWLKRGYWLAREGLCYYLQWEPQFDDHQKLYDAACKIINDGLTDDKPEPK